MDTYIIYDNNPYATHGAGIFTYMTGPKNRINGGIHVPAPWSIWEWYYVSCKWDMFVCTWEITESTSIANMSQASEKCIYQGI